MESWRYSGRGRQGGGNRTFVRGRGRGIVTATTTATSGRMTWVRPKDTVVHATEATDTNLGTSDSSPVNVSKSAPRTTLISTDTGTTRSASGPVLKGPGCRRWEINGRHANTNNSYGRGRSERSRNNRGRGRGRGRSHQSTHNSWRREEVHSASKEESSTKRTQLKQSNNQPVILHSKDEAEKRKEEEGKTEIIVDQFADASDDELQSEPQEQTGDDNQFSDSPNDSDLDLDKSDLPRNIESEPAGEHQDAVGKEENYVSTNQQFKKVVSYESVRGVPQENTSDSLPNENPIAIIDGGLPLESDKEKQAATDTSTLSSDSSERSQLKQGRMVRKGSNKLVFSNGSSRVDTTTNAESQNLGHQVRRTGVNRRKRPISPANAPTIKRIKINVAGEAATTEEETKEENTNRSGESKGKNGVVCATNDRLTDFAYREVSSSRGRGGRFHPARGGRGGGRGRQNMGLVRVNPDETNTPICPTFLRGIRCENELCRKRHDVPIESARPVCSFFQRHGQCLKGSDCPFRHVKVNPLAILCPSFNLMGYCDDEKCVMKHVAANKSTKNSHRAKFGSDSSANATVRSALGH